MKLRATATPIATATAVPVPIATEPATPRTVAVIAELLDASIVTLPTGSAAVPTVLDSIHAWAVELATFVDSEPPPLAAMPVLPTAIARATASDVTLIVWSSVAWTRTSPPPVETLGTLAMLAQTALSIRLCASASPMATDTPVALPLPEMLADAASASASMLETSLAVTLTSPSADKVGGPSTVASTTLSISLKLSAPVAPTATDVALVLMATAMAMPKASESILASLSADTVTAPSESTSESSTAARVVLSIVLIVSEIPRATPTAVFWLTAIASATAPAVALIHDSSDAVTLMPAPLPASVVSVLPLCTSACVLLRILLMPIEPATSTAMPASVLDPATLPAAPMPSAKMPASISASTVIAPAAVTSESSISAQTRLPSPSPSIVLMANDAPIATAAAVPLPATANEIATAPAPAMISESLPASTVLDRRMAVVSASIWLMEPEPAPAPATPLPCCLATAAANAPATVNAWMLPVEVASMRSSPVTRKSPLSVSRSHVISLDSTSASVSVMILLTAMATPADTAVALPVPPLAIARDSAPAIAKISESSGPRIRTLLSTGPASSLSVVSIIRARVALVTSFSETAPARASVNVLPLDVPPPATAPAPPAASVQMWDRLSAMIEKLCSAVSTTKSSNATLCTVTSALRTKPSTSAWTRL